MRQINFKINKYVLLHSSIIAMISPLTPTKGGIPSVQTIHVTRAQASAHHKQKRTLSYLEKDVFLHVCAFRVTSPVIILFISYSLILQLLFFPFFLQLQV